MKNVLRVGVRGFTLVELMVVVAIIGILASVAIPQYGKFQGKARQSEAKVQLGAVLTAERAFQVEATSFTSCLAAIGYSAPSANNYYLVGFSGGNLTANGATCVVGSAPGTATWFPATLTKNGSAYPASGDLPGNTSTSSTFTAGAAGYVSTSVLDKWTVDHNGTFVNTQAGI